MAGYSKRTLVQKLGIKAEQRVALFAVPENVGPLLAQQERVHRLAPAADGEVADAFEIGAVRQARSCRSA